MVSLISVVGALLGTFLGGWVSLRATAKQHALQRQDQESRLLDDSFFRAVDELETYRRKELTRAHEAARDGVPVSEAPSVVEVRDARSTCRRALLSHKIHSREPGRTKELDDILVMIESIPDQKLISEVRSVSKVVNERIEAAVLDYSESRQFRLDQ